jgi:hypothetical protein
MRHALALALSLGILSGAAPTVTGAQATRTWVSGVGDDVNPCSRTAPCKTFAGAISKTAAGGEIDALDPGGYGGVTITKNITINGTGTLAGVLTAGAGVNGIVINGPDIVVTLRNLELHGVSSAQDGVRFLNGKQLIIENTRISGYVRGVFVPLMAGAGTVVIKNSTFSGNVDALKIQYGTTNISNSVITGNSANGLHAENTGIINATENRLLYNYVAVRAGNGASGQANATVRVSNNDIYRNTSAFQCSGGVISSDGNNRTGGDPTGCVPNGTLLRY